MILDENWLLEASEQQWTLKYSKSTISKDGKVTKTKREYFYNNISHALNAYIDKKLKAAETISEAILLLNQTVKNLKSKGFSQNI